MLSRPVPESAMPAMSGTSSGPAGILDLAPTMAPTTARGIVSQNGPAATAGNQSTAALTASPGATHSRATIEATRATSITRRNCMKATSRGSPPKLPDISTITVAAPGVEPHTAVDPGNTFQRASNAPCDVLMTNTEQTPARNSGHW